VRKRASDRRGTATLWSCIALAVAVSGCGGKNYSNNGAQNQPITTAFLRVTNTISDSPILLAGLDGTTLTRVSYGQATALQQVPSGKYALDVQYIDTNGNAVAVINKETLDLTVDDQDTVYLLGTLGTLRTKLVENPAPSIAAGNAEVQVVQASARAGSIDLYLTDPTADLATATKLTTVAFEEASPLSTVSSSGSYRLRVTAAGGMTVLYDSGTFTIDDQSRVTFVVVDYFGPGGNGFRVLDQDSQVARLFPAEALPAALRVANMVADQPSVDVYLGPVGGTPAFAGVPYGTVAPLQQISAGALTYSVTVAGDATMVLATGSVTLTAGEQRTLVATRGLSDVATRASVDATRPISGQGQIGIINAAPSAAAVDAYLLPPGTTVDTVAATIVDQPVLSFASAVRAPGAVDTVFTQTGVKTPIAGPTTVDVTDGGIYAVYVFDAAGGGAPYQILVGSN
jgi:hypothetical protein